LKHFELGKNVFIAQPNPNNFVYNLKKRSGVLSKFPYEQPFSLEELKEFNLNLDIGFINRWRYPNYLMVITNKK